MLRILIAMYVLALVVASHARDDGRYAKSPLKPWFDSLQNKNGAGCCSDADGVRLDDPEWRCASSEDCEVRLDGKWQRVPPEAILETTNRVGYPIVWRLPGDTTIRCFLRGSEI
jgi:hypothetical protein